MTEKRPARRHVIIAAEKSDKRDRIQRSLQLMFQKTGEKDIDWHLAATTETAIEQINLALANLKDVTDSLEILVAMSGFQGQWFEIGGYVKIIMANTKNAIKAVLMSGHPEDVHNAELEGLHAINTLLSEPEIAKYAAQILLGEPADFSHAEDTTEGQEYQTEEQFSQEPGRKPWEYVTST